MSWKCAPTTSKTQWESFLREIHPHTFLQSWAWGETQERSGAMIERVGIWEDDVLQAISLLIIVRARRGSFVFCPHGPIVRSLEKLQPVIKVLLARMNEIASAEKCTFIRICPLISNTTEHRHIFASLGFRDAPIHMMHPELSLMLDLSPSEDTLLAAMRKTTRYSIRKAEKDGVTIQTSDRIEDLDRFWSVYESTVARQHFTPFSKKYLETEIETFLSHDGIRFFFANYQGKTIAAALIIFYGGSAYYHHGASDQIHAKIPASYLLQWHAIQEAKRRGCTVYNFWGVVPEHLTKHPWAGLSLFKRGFGGYEEAYLHAQDMPRSSRYWITYLIEKIRRFKRGL